mgnify:CR=1 FL=1
MDNTIIIVLGIILLVLVILNHITIVTTTGINTQGNCAQTTFGCCPDGVNSKINYFGTNCPGYKPTPPPPPGPGPNPPKPIGGCAGTRYGCCPHSNQAKRDVWGSNC